jgi:hypothetical protein
MHALASIKHKGSVGIVARHRLYPGFDKHSQAELLVLKILSFFSRAIWTMSITSIAIISPRR